MSIEKQKQLVSLVKELNTLGIHAIEQNDRGPGKRAVISVSKRFVELELLVIQGQLFIGLKSYPSLGEDLRLKLINELSLEGFITKNNPLTQVNIRYPSKDFVNDIIKAKTFIESRDYLENSQLTWKTTNFDKRFNTIARYLQIDFDNNDTSAFDRSTVDALTPRVAINEYFKGSQGEHVVPIDFLQKTSLEMYKNGATVQDVEQFWKDNLIVKFIKQEQSHYLDYDLGLKTTMPEGWNPGDDPMVRIKLLEEVK